MERIQIALPDGVYKVFKEFQKARGGSESDVGKLMIEDYLSRNGLLLDSLKENMKGE